MPKRNRKKGQNLKKYGRIVIFIDAANIIYSLKDLGWKINYKKLRRYFERNSKLVDIYFYSAKWEGKDSEESFLSMLSRIGFKLRTKRLKFVKHNDGSSHPKGNVDVDLTVDMMSLLPKYDTAVLMSGDGDFQAVVNFVRSKGKKVIVVSTRWHIAKELIEAADMYINLRDLRKYAELK